MRWHRILCHFPAAIAISLFVVAAAAASAIWLMTSSLPSQDRSEPLHREASVGVMQEKKGVQEDFFLGAATGRHCAQLRCNSASVRIANFGTAADKQEKL